MNPSSTDAEHVKRMLRDVVADHQLKLDQLWRLVDRWRARAQQCRDDDATRDPLDMAYAAAADTLAECADELVKTLMQPSREPKR